LGAPTPRARSVSLHGALPIFQRRRERRGRKRLRGPRLGGLGLPARVAITRIGVGRSQRARARSVDMIGFGLDGRDSLEPPMIRPRHAGYLGIVALAWFWLATVIFGALRPGYSHVVNEISELGVMGTPNAVWWNVLGF